MSKSVSTVVSIQILRFFAAFAVALFHSHGAILVRTGIPEQRAYTGPWSLGASGVHVFFIISGFVMVLTTQRGESRMPPLTFLRRRFIRIYPIYWFLAGVYLLSDYLSGKGIGFGFQEIAYSLALYSNYASTIIGQGWTLSYEMYFYICFAISLLFRNGIWLITGFFLLSIAAGLSPLGHEFPIATNVLLVEFVLGCWLGRAYLARPALLGPLGWPCLAVGTVLLFLTVLLPEAWPRIILWGPPSFLIVLGALSVEHSLRTSSARHLARLGDSSYFLYLSHAILLGLFVLMVPTSISIPISLVAIPLALLCVIVAHLGHFWIEAPMLSAYAALTRERRLVPNSEDAAPTKGVATNVAR